MDKKGTTAHEQFMQHCLKLAREAKKQGHTPVGSIIVKEGKVISEAREGDNVLPSHMAHAEAAAIVKALSKTGGKDLRDAVLYTTVEPCFMCAYLIRKTKIREVVFGIRTEQVGGFSSNYPFLAARDIPKWEIVPIVTEGILGGECRALF